MELEVYGLYNENTVALTCPHGHVSTVTRAVFSPDGSKVLTGSVDGAAKLWDVNSGDCLRTFFGPPHSEIRSLLFSPDVVSSGKTQDGGPSFDR